MVRIVTSIVAAYSLTVVFAGASAQCSQDDARCRGEASEVASMLQVKAYQKNQCPTRDNPGFIACGNGDCVRVCQHCAVCGGDCTKNQHGHCVETCSRNQVNCNSDYLAFSNCKPSCSQCGPNGGNSQTCNGDCVNKPDGSTRILVKSDTGLCITAANLETGAQVSIGSCGWDYEQRFVFAEDGTIKVSSKTELCLNAKSGDLKSGDPIQLFTCTGDANEKFERRSDGTIRVQSKPTLCLNAKGGKLQHGDIIQLFACTGTPNEVFRDQDVVTWGNCVRKA